MNNKIDLRVIKTKKILFEALVTLMEQKDFEKIKISDICDQALINRSTFYAHYEDKYDLLLAMINDLKNNLEHELKENKEEDISKNYFMEFLKILINHVDEKRETYNSILKNDKNGIVMGFLIDVSYRDLTSRLKNNNLISIIPIDVITKFYIGGIVNVGIDWIKNKNKYIKEELLLYFDKLIPDKIWLIIITFLNNLYKNSVNLIYPIFFLYINSNKFFKA